MPNSSEGENQLPHLHELRFMSVWDQFLGNAGRLFISGLAPDTVYQFYSLSP